MSCDYEKLPHPGIQTLKPYVPGKSVEEIAKTLGIKDIIKLASNENPLGCSLAAQKALASLSPSTIASYPAPLIHPLSKKIAENLAVEQEMITLGNGSDTLYSLLLTLFALHNAKHIITHQYAFSTYAIQANTLGIPVVTTPVKKDWQVDIDAIITRCNAHTALIFIANPNNPTGTFIALKEIERLLNNIPESTILVLDEAYYEFSYPKNHPACLSLLAKYPNLVLTRTFSKAYGLAGLRLGYAIANPCISLLMQKVQLPFVINQAALNAAMAALDDEAFLEKTLKNNASGLKQMRKGLGALNYNLLPSRCNFLTFDCVIDAQIIYNRLLQHGIILRPLTPYGLSHHLRVTIGTKEQNNRVLDTLKELMHEQ